LDISTFFAVVFVVIEKHFVRGNKVSGIFNFISGKNATNYKPRKTSTIIFPKRRTVYGCLISCLFKNGYSYSINRIPFWLR